eukprot:1452299-Prymnesium_polylepis.1
MDAQLASQTLPICGTAALLSLASETVESGSSVLMALKHASTKHVRWLPLGRRCCSSVRLGATMAPLVRNN